MAERTRKPGPGIVAIDGVLGSGKTTVARLVAKRLGIPYLDTGAMYRCIGLAAERTGVDVTRAAEQEGVDRDATVELARRVQLSVEEGAGGQVVTMDRANVTAEIRTPEAARYASLVATIPGVRAAMVDQQRRWANLHGSGVMEGRDIASVVIPDAPTKIFLTASVQERAQRRHDQEPERNLDEVLADLRWRDENDSTRAADPLQVSDGATVLDTTGLTIDEVVERIVDLAAAGAVVASRGGAAEPRDSHSDIDDLHSPESTARRLNTTRRQLAVFAVVRAIVVGLVTPYFRVQYEGLENIPAKGAFVVSPVHRSLIDFALLPRLTKRRMRYLGKDSIWRYRALRSFIDALGGIPVRRGSSDRESLRVCSEVLSAGEALVVFPEGTRKSGDRIGEIFDGAAYLAAKHHVPIVPVGIGGSEGAMPRGSRFPRRVRVRVIVGMPILASGTKRSDVRAATATLHERLGDLFDQASGRR